MIYNTECFTIPIWSHPIWIKYLKCTVNQTVAFIITTETFCLRSHQAQDYICKHEKSDCIASRPLAAHRCVLTAKDVSRCHMGCVLTGLWEGQETARYVLNLAVTKEHGSSWDDGSRGALSALELVTCALRNPASVAMLVEPMEMSCNVLPSWGPWVRIQALPHDFLFNAFISLLHGTV